MATGTAWYNLTKPASNENYNVGIWNTNLDMIDAQMHQNETEVFGGATSLANGTVGNVPAPLIADKDKYLKGDGTWDTPSGGGGSTVTITPTLATGRKIAEYEIDGTNGSLFAPLVEITGEASGSIATFTDGADGKPVKNLEISIEPQQDLHGYGYPWAEGSGKNKLKINATSQTVKGVTFTVNNDGSITVDGTTTEANCFFNLNYVPRQFNVPTNVSINIGLYGRNRPSTVKIQAIGNSGVNEISYGGTAEFGISENNTLTTTSASTATWTRLQIQDAGTTINNITVYPFWCYSDNKMTSYEPYSNICPISGHAEADVTVTDDLTTPTETHTLSIPFHDSNDNPITVYGGTLNVTSGELKVDRADVNLGTQNYSYYSGNLFTAQISNLKPVPNEMLCNALCSIYVAKKGIEYASIDGSFVAGFNNSRTLAIHDSRFTDATAFKTAMNGVQLVYELATPQTYQLTPTQVSTLLGQNNIFADCGDVEEVVYVRDINLAFNQLEARVATLEGSNSRSVSLTKSAPIEETKEETKEEEPNEVKEKEEKDDN